MSVALAAACFWLVVANVIAILPSRDHHWRAAYGLIALGVPILIWVALSESPWIALVFLVAGGWILRWPVIYLWRWLRRVAGL